MRNDRLDSKDLQLSGLTNNFSWFVRNPYIILLGATEYKKISKPSLKNIEKNFEYKVFSKTYIHKISNSKNT